MKSFIGLPIDVKRAIDEGIISKYDLIKAAREGKSTIRKRNHVFRILIIQLRSIEEQHVDIYWIVSHR